ncbi:hypothetical protein [Minwuia sp.]|uniref:hypothetical protein n=1 Tax=Minwuia sp. TaxID=2493630 RepID=UPI003A8CF661
MDGNPLPPRTASILDREKFEHAARAAGLERVVFLAGPFIQTNKRPRKNAKNKAMRLRYKLFHALSDAGWAVTLGEYENLLKAPDALLGDENNAVLAEVLHARSDSTDAVVMLPSSPGSFLEFGAFSTIEEICRKMIIIIDEQYKDKKDYMNTGPVKGARDNGAEVHFIDYDEFDECLDEVDKFITRQARRKAKRQVFGQ